MFFANLFHEPKMQSIDYKVFETRCIIFEERKNLKDCNLLPNSSIACITSYQTEFIAVQPSMLLENLQILVPSQQKTIIIALQSSTAVRAVADWNMAFFDGGN